MRWQRIVSILTSCVLLDNWNVWKQIAATKCKVLVQWVEVRYAHGALSILTSMSALYSVQTPLLDSCFGDLAMFEANWIALRYPTIGH